MNPPTRTNHDVIHHDSKLLVKFTFCRRRDIVSLLPSTCLGMVISACHQNWGRLHRSVLYKLHIMKILASDEVEIIEHNSSFNRDNHHLYASLLSFKPKFPNIQEKNQNNSYQSCSQKHSVMDEAFL